MSRNRHPWLVERFAAVRGLADEVRIWTFLAAHTAQGELEAVAHDWTHLPPTAHAGGIEIILQTHLFAGYPLTINALSRVHALGIESVRTGEAPAETWSGAGGRGDSPARGKCRRLPG